MSPRHVLWPKHFGSTQLDADSFQAAIRDHGDRMAGDAMADNPTGGSSATGAALRLSRYSLSLLGKVVALVALLVILGGLGFALAPFTYYYETQGTTRPSYLATPGGSKVAHCASPVTYLDGEGQLGSSCEDPAKERLGLAAVLIVLTLGGATGALAISGDLQTLRAQSKPGG